MHEKSIVDDALDGLQPIKHPQRTLRMFYKVLLGNMCTLFPYLHVWTISQYILYIYLHMYGVFQITCLCTSRLRNIKKKLQCPMRGMMDTILVM